jgi:2-hydroxy-3-keto-5-methylthiopentenyl-1-phosphate phosphatase
MSNSRLAFFCDFDGTVARQDVGYHLFHHFSGGRNDALLPDWKAGRLSTRDCMRIECEMVSGTPEEIYRFIDQFDLDPTFPKFAQICRDAGAPIVIVSEGLDLYINRLLASHAPGHFNVKCNLGHLEGDGIRIEFPYENRVCPGCGNCKAARIEEFRTQADGNCRIVFVGDGYSDACGARAADLVFAKKDLVRYCQKEGILYNEFRNFEDVTDQLILQGHWPSRNRV